MQKRIRAFLVITVIALLLGAASGCAGKSAVAVTTAAAANQSLGATLDLSGVLVPSQEADISSQIAGKVTALNFQAGNTVKTGDVLMQLDTQALNAQLAQAQAGLQSAEAAENAAKINLDEAQRTYNQAKALYAAGAASQSQLDNDTDAYDSASRPGHGPGRSRRQHR